MDLIAASLLVPRNAPMAVHALLQIHARVYLSGLDAGAPIRFVEAG